MADRARDAALTLIVAAATATALIVVAETSKAMELASLTATNVLHPAIVVQMIVAFSDIAGAAQQMKPV